MTVRLNVKDIKEHGLEIITPLDPSFDHLAAKYFKGKPSAELEAFRPFSVFIKNRSNKYLVAYVLKWEILRTDGTATTGFKAYAQPGVLMGYGVGIRTTPGAKHIIDPGSVRLFSLAGPLDADEVNPIGSAGSQGPATQDGSFDPSAKVAERIKAQLRQSTSVTVSLDGAFFADGSFVGPNTSGYFEMIKAEIDAKKDLLTQIADAGDSPAALDRVFASVESVSNTQPSPPSVDSSPNALYKYYAQEFAREIVGLKDSYGKTRTTDHLRGLHNLRKPAMKKLDR